MKYVIENLPSPSKETEIQIYETWIENENKSKLFSFFFSLHFDGFCCGITNIGGFETADYGATKLQKTKLIRDTLNQLSDNYKGEDDQKMLIIFTLIDNETCNLIQASQTKSSHFKDVGNFINSNSSHKNHVYMNF